MPHATSDERMNNPTNVAGSLNSVMSPAVQLTTAPPFSPLPADPLALVLRIVQRMEERQQRLEHRLETVLTAVQKDKVNDAWLDEAVAAAMLNLHPRTLRRKCLADALPVKYRNTAGRAYQYNRRDLVKYQQQTSTSL